MLEREHRVRVLEAWPSGRFVACICAEQSPASRNEDDLVAWTYAHLGLDAGPGMPAAEVTASRSWSAVPDDGLF